MGDDVYRAASIHDYLNNEPVAHPAPLCDQSSNDPARLETVISLNTVHAGRQASEQSLSSRGTGYSSLAAKTSKDQTQLDILDKSLVKVVTADAEREAPALKQELAIQSDDLLSLSTNMQNDEGQLDILNGSLDIANAKFKAPTVNQSTPAAEPSLLSTQTRSDECQIDTLNGLLDASNLTKEELMRAFASQEIELVSLSAKSRNDQGLIDALNKSLATANSAYEGLRKVIASQATELTFLSAKTRNDQVQIDTLNRSLNAVEAEHEELRRAFISQEVELSSFSANSRNNQGQIDALNTSLVTARTEHEELWRAFTSQAAELQSLSTKTRDDQVQIDVLKQSLGTAHAEQEESRQLFTSQAAAQMKADEDQLHNLTRSFQKVRKERDAAKRALVSRTDELSVLSAEMQDLERTQINALHTLIDTTTAERETLREQAKLASEALERTENDLNTMRSERAEREIQIHTLQAEIAHLTRSNTKHVAEDYHSPRRNPRTHRPSRSAQSTNAVAGPSRIHSHNTATYPQLHGTGLQPVWRREQIQYLFKCGVCMTEKPMDDVTPLHPCGHQFCRDCVKNYVGAKLDDRSFPILCPICMTDGGRASPGSA
jgi:chromosome segregation ATPase